MEYFNEEEVNDIILLEKNRMYIDYNESLFTFHKVDEEEKILEVDLDNEEIVDPNEDKEENGDLEIQSKTDLITLCYFPVCQSHCNITLCYEQDLPQVLSSELIQQFINIFSLIKNDSLVCGYDSLGAGCTINHLHFEFLMLDDFKGEQINILPIESVKDILLFETKLVHKNKEEISMFDATSLIKLSKIVEPYFAWKIECIEDNNSMDSLYQVSISHIVNFLLSKLIDKQIPHNLILTHQGKVFYLIPRKFEDKSALYNSCWNDLGGLVTVKDENTFKENSLENYKKFLKEKVCLEQNKFDEINNMVINEIDNIYEIIKY